MICTAVECLENRRLFAAGQLDPTFGVSGVAHPSIVLSDSIRFAVPAPGGKTVFVGAVDQTKTIIARTNSDGTLDTTFNNGAGFIERSGDPGDGNPQSVAVDPKDGRIAIVTYIDFRVIAFTIEIDVFKATGQFDSSFDGDGRSFPVSNMTSSFIPDIGVATFDPSGRLLFSATERNEDEVNARLRIIRVKRDGSFDSSWTPAEGITPSAFVPQPGQGVRKLAVAPNGRVLIGQDSLTPISDTDVATLRVFAQRANDNGSLDGGFGPPGSPGTATLMTSTNNASRSAQDFIDLELTSNSGVLAMSDYQINSSDEETPAASGYQIYKLTPAGLPDTTFGTGGSLLGGFHIGSLRETAMDLTVDPFTGRILVSGEVAPVTDGALPRPFVRRFLANGTLDGTFGNAGAWYGPSGVDFVSLQIRSDGKLLVNGADTNNGSIEIFAIEGDARAASPGTAMLLANGMLDLAGTSKADVVDVRRSGGNLRVTMRGKVTTYLYSAVKSIRIRAAASDDKITVGDFVRGLYIDGGDGNDAITAGMYNDTITGGAGNDTVRGGDGDDSINAGDGDDVVSAGAGNDSVSGGMGADRIDAGDGNDLIYGGDPLNANALDAGDIIQGQLGNDTLYGQNGNDSLYGNEGTDRLLGGGGKNILVE
jgi:uncharacterized delta-60 repeat protein